MGDAFAVQVLASSPTQSVNAVSGELTFSSDKLKVISVSKAASVMSLWVQDPSFSNTAGTVDFAGVILNPGYTGGAGNVITVNFKAINSGSAKLGFSSGSLLANDGNGTNILSTLGTAQYAIGISGNVPAVVPSSGIPAPTITSTTHPDPTKWYTSDSPQFSFSFPSSATALKLLFDKQPASAPTNLYEPVIITKTLMGVSEGVWYMHASYKTDAGWSDTANFRVNIDHTLPSTFVISDPVGRDTTISAVRLGMSATDAVSYIDHYELSIDNGTYTTWKDDGGGIYTTPELLPGTHTIRGRAVDAAGNIAYASLDFPVTGLPAPTISDYTKDISGSQPIFVKGTATPGFIVRLFVLDSNGAPVKVSESTVASDGSFNLAWQPDGTKLAQGGLMSPGLHSMIVYGWSISDQVTNGSPKLPIVVSGSTISQIGTGLFDFLVVVVPIIALLLLLLLLILHGVRKARDFRKEIRTEAAAAESVLHQAFAGMRENLEKYVETLENASAERRLTDEERTLVKAMKQNLDDAEKIVGKEIVVVEETVRK